MAWNMNDYPSSWKNMDRTVRKKAIEIGNAMLEDGHDEGRAIPIATEQAKEWRENASESEIQQFLKEEDTTPENDRDGSRPELLERPQFVTPHSEGGWAVQAEGAYQPSEVFENKKEAVTRGREIARNKGTQLIIHREDDSVEEKHNYER
ncbi:DUF2188 domain-containing protein [Salicibibacter kimchii]|uniref:DUF2188 domain-containing protein n=1 Tax=Salicibibacter kimchii TaxID=2099786 RepID=A0A345BZS0_9BACI|nr:DUF2188 domain-containing protein [Salicibibacter kimchii]AXF56451.1 DUF2188 domain-containing protein [Salicibibacter kimchii]